MPSTMTHNRSITRRVPVHLDAAYRRNWVPACGGTETAFRCRDGRMLLYVWDTFSGDHAYLDVETDMVLEDSEAFALVSRH